VAVPSSSSSKYHLILSATSSSGFLSDFLYESFARFLVCRALCRLETRRHQHFHRYFAFFPRWSSSVVPCLLEQGPEVPFALQPGFLFGEGFTAETSRFMVELCVIDNSKPQEWKVVNDCAYIRTGRHIWIFLYPVRITTCTRTILPSTYIIACMLAGNEVRSTTSCGRSKHGLFKSYGADEPWTTHVKKISATTTESQVAISPVRLSPRSFSVQCTDF